MFGMSIDTDAAVQELAKYSMVTIEKWYGECGSKHPIQSGSWCNVEQPMYTTFNAIKAANPNVTTIMYLNSMFDFSMYNLDGLVNAVRSCCIILPCMLSCLDGLFNGMDGARLNLLRRYLREKMTAPTKSIGCFLLVYWGLELLTIMLSASFG